ncbi:MAG: M56 family metallopeptidase [Blastocatellia bacterium]
MEIQLLDWSLRAALMAAGTAVALGVLRVRTPAARHTAWTGVLVAMLLLPVLTTWGPKAPLPVLPATREQLSPVAPAPEGTLMRPAPQYAEDKRIPDTSRPSVVAEAPIHTWNWEWNWRWMAMACYFAGFGVMVIRLAVGSIQVRKMARQATFVDGAYVSAQCAAPVTVGWLRPVVILPEDWQSWPEAKLDAVLTHEREHVRRRDPLVQWLALLNRCVYWFHPLAWRLERKLSDLAEEACDAAALRRGHTPADYSQYLIELARSVERAGSRVSVRGAAINGGALSVRIRRILDSKPLPPLSRTRSTVAAALCLSVLAVISACKPERASNPALGQPTMNELMHRRAAESQTWEKQRQALLDEVQRLTPDQARALEADLKANPRDREKLSKLVRYYQIKLGGQGFSAITLWYIEHEPTMGWAWNINPEWDRAGYERGKKLWLAHLKKPGAEAAIYRNAARFLEGGDRLLAEQVLLDGQKAYPNEKWTGELSDHYTQALLGAVGPLAEGNVIRAVSMKEAHGAYARSVRRKLAASNDPQILAQIAQSLFFRGLQTDCNNRSLFDFDVRALAGSYADRALSLQPDFPGALSLKLMMNSFKTGERIRNTPPDKLSKSDRMWLLLNHMENASVEKNLDETESKARELLALAAQSTNDPEYGNAIFFANLTLGDAALRRGDKHAAARYLLAASDAPPTDRLRYAYISMNLARQLVDWGEREAVAQFLERCARFNQRGKDLAEWAAQIRKGTNPDLTPYRSG